MRARGEHFAVISRVLHWAMAAMILAMLLIGITMAATIGSTYDALLSLHRPLGILILILVVLRLLNRLISPPPKLPIDLPAAQRLAARGSHVALYGLMALMPLVGWGMLSAGRYPVVMWGGLRLPWMLPHDLALYAGLRELHTVLGVALFALVLLHVSAALYHGLIRRDGVLQSMG